MKTERTDIDVRQMMKKRVKGLVGILLAAVMLFAAVPAQNVQAAGDEYQLYCMPLPTGLLTGWSRNGNDLELQDASYEVNAGDRIAAVSGAIIELHCNWTGGGNTTLNESSYTKSSYTIIEVNGCSQFRLQFQYVSDGRATVTLTPIIAAPVQEEEPEKQEEPSDTHQHDMQWTVLKKPTLTENGKEGYRCTICGYVDESASGSGTRTKSVSAYRYFGESVIKGLKEAQPGETILIDALVWKSCYKDVYEAIAARPDVTVTFRFAFDGYIFDTTIPAGADVLSLLNEEGYIGFLKLAEVYGAVMVSEE